MIRRIFSLITIALTLPLLVWAQTQIKGNAQPWTAPRIEEMITNIANFLITVGIIGAVITIVLAGILYFGSGVSPKAVEKAKGLFKNALIGTLLILGVGVIINTVAVLVTGDFFGAGVQTGGGGGSGGGPPTGGGQTSGVGDNCINNDDCINGLECKHPSRDGICGRRTGNLSKEKCVFNSDCAEGLVCYNFSVCCKKIQNDRCVL